VYGACTWTACEDPVRTVACKILQLSARYSRQRGTQTDALRAV